MAQSSGAQKAAGPAALPAAARRFLPVLGGLLLFWRIGADHYPNEVLLYANDGVRLIHGLGAGYLSRLPAASILAAIMSSSHRRLVLTHGLLALDLTVLLLAVECLLSAGAFLGAAPALAALFPASDYAQGFLSLYLLTTAGLLIRYVESPQYANALWLSLAIGASFLFRSTLAFLPPVLAVCAPAFWLRAKGSTRAKHALLLLIVPYLFTLPVLRANYTLTGRLLPFENGEASCNIVTGALGVVGTVEGPWDALPGAPKDPAHGGLLAWAAGEIARHPLRYAAAYALRVGYAVAWCGPFIPFALWALWSRRQRKEFQALGLLLAYWIGIHCLMSVQSNYFYPLGFLAILLALSWAAGFLPKSGAGPAPRRFFSAFLLSSLALSLAFDGYAAALLGAEGKTTLDQAIERAPNDWRLLKMRGEDRLRQGAVAGAVADLSRSLALLPSDYAKTRTGFEAELRLAAAQAFQGDFERARGLSTDDDRLGDDSADIIAKVHLLRAYAWSQTRPALAAEEIKSAGAARVSGVSVRGLQNTRGQEVLQQLQAGRGDDFAPWLSRQLSDWPPAARRQLAEASGPFSQPHPPVDFPAPEK